MGLPADLPICEVEQGVRDALRRGPVVITSPTGSGKSTWVPLWAADLHGSALVVEPRRVACRSLARFVAGATGGRLGQQVGYAVRHDDRLGPDTRVAYVTPGLALQMAAGDGLARFGCVLLDEFHQRSQEVDLLLALLRARGERRLGVLSATLDGRRVADHMDATLVAAEGRLYPVQVRHLGDDPVPSGRGLPERVAAALGRLRGGEGDVLIFLPGKPEIGACLRHLAGHPEFEPLPLHAQLSHDEQDRAFVPAARRRAILSTNVAETSVTLPGVRAVIDSGLVRRTVYREGRGALATTPVAMDAADQRAGRAGRLAPGVCLRLWSEAGMLEQQTPPEILREDLSQLVLHAAQLGHRAEALPWLDPPRDFALADAHELLVSLGLLDEAGGMTPAGRQVGRLPVDPVLGRLLQASKRAGALPDMIPLVAALSLGGPLFLPGHPRPPEDGLDDPLTASRCDAEAHVLALRRPKLARGRVRPEALAEARRVARQLHRSLDARPAPEQAAVDRDALARAVLAALPLAAFARRPRKAEAWGNGKVELRLGRDTLIQDRVPTVLAVDQRLTVERGRSVRRYATCAMPVTPAWLRRHGAGRQQVVGVRVKQGVLLARMRWLIGTTSLEEQEQVPRGDAAASALLRLLREERYMAAEVQAARREVEAFVLREILEGRPRPQGFEPWLERRVTSLDFDDGEDLALLTAGDLAPGLLEAFELQEVERRFPPTLSLGGQRLRLTYDPAGRRVTLRASRPGHAPPRRDFLPRWPGWRLMYDNGKHVVEIP